MLMLNRELYEKARALGLNVWRRFSTDSKKIHYYLILDCSPSDLADLVMTHCATQEDINGFVGHARTHKYNTPSDAQIEAINSFLETNRP